MNRELATAVLVNFCHTNFQFVGELYTPGIPHVIPCLLTEPDFISALFSSYSDLRYWILYTDQTVLDFISTSVSVAIARHSSGRLTMTLVDHYFYHSFPFHFLRHDHFS